MFYLEVLKKLSESHNNLYQSGFLDSYILFLNHQYFFTDIGQALFTVLFWDIALK